LGRGDRLDSSLGAGERAATSRTATVGCLSRISFAKREAATAPCPQPTATTRLKPRDDTREATSEA